MRPFNKIKAKFQFQNNHKQRLETEIMNLSN